MRQPILSNANRGFSLIELLVAMALGLIVLAGAVTLFRQGVDISFTVTQRAEMQQNARVALNLLARDLAIAGTGMPPGGITLPSGAGAQNPLRGCQDPACATTFGAFAENPPGSGVYKLFPLTPGDGLGVQVALPGAVANTDIVTVVYDDTTIALDQCPTSPPNLSATPSGSQLSFNPANSCPALSDVAIGDFFIICGNGCAAAAVTSVNTNSGRIGFANNDSLNINQPSAAFGNVASVLDPPAGPAIPNPTTYRRILVTTYFIQMAPGPDGVPATADDYPRLMLQVNAQPPVPVAENVEDLQFTYDIFDDNAGVATVDLPDAGNAPNQIRKAKIIITVRAPIRGVSGRDFERITVSTSVSVRNLTFRDRFPGTTP